MNKLKLLHFRKSILQFSTDNKLKIPFENTIEKWRIKFQTAQIEEPDFTLKSLAAHTLRREFSSISDVKSLEMNENDLQKFEKFCECRLANVPLQYILGEWEFRDITLKMQPPVFIPRPETERLVDLIMSDLNIENEFNFIEIGCGTGAISLAILNAHRNAVSVALDRSQLACDLTVANANSLNFENRITVYNHVMQSKTLLPENLKSRKFNAIISNPPYIKTNVLQTLAPEILLYENLNALDGGPDGLRVARVLIELAISDCLLVGGKLWMELDSSHPMLIKKIIEKNYSKFLTYLGSHKDIYGKERFVEILKIS